MIEMYKHQLKVASEKSTLPKTPDCKKINELLIEINKKRIKPMMTSENTRMIGAVEVMNRLNGYGSDPGNIGRILKEKWEQEPDFVDLRFNKYHLVIYRHPQFGHLNGYVGIKRNHLYFGKGLNSKQVKRLTAHGGITFAGERVGEGFRKGYWYLGFDTAHAFDCVPLFEKMKNELIGLRDPVFKKLNDLMHFFSSSINMNMEKENYKDIDYVSHEVMNLYFQLKKVEDRNPNYQHNFVKEYKRLHREKLRAKNALKW